jgi:hypothetical protein
MFVYLKKVYDGWNTSSQVLYYDEFATSNLAQAKRVVYSNSQKMMVRFTRPKFSGNRRIYWSASTVRSLIISSTSQQILSFIYADTYGSNHHRPCRDDRNDKKPQLSRIILSEFFRLSLENRHTTKHKHPTTFCIF